MRQIFFSLLLFPFSAYAIDYSWSPQINIGTRATDNLRSAVNGKESALGFDMGGGVKMRAESADWQTSILPTFNFRRFAVGDNADADEYGVGTKNQWKAKENLTLSLDFDFTHDSTLSTELADDGIRTDIIGRDIFTVEPGFEYVLDDRTLVNASFMYSDTIFEHRPGTGFVDYNYAQVNLGASRVITERWSISVSSFASRFQTPDTKGESRTYGGQIGSGFKISDSLSLNAAVGHSLSDIDFESQKLVGFTIAGIDPITGQQILTPLFDLISEDTSATGWLANFGVVKMYEQSKLSFEYGRAISPSSRGAQTISDDMKVEWSVVFSPKWTAQFRSGYNMRSTQNGQAATNGQFLDRDQFTFTSALQRRVSKEMTIGALYRFYWNQQQNPGRSIYNNGLFMTLTYSGKPHFYHGN